MFNKLHPKLIVSCKFYLLVFCLAATPAVNGSDAELDQLLRLVDARLQLMKSVAAYKFANNIAVENHQREAQVLDQARKSAELNQLRPEAVEAFFRLQIELAKFVQLAWMAHWRANDEHPGDSITLADFDGEIRPKLLALGEQIIKQIPLALPALHDNQQFNQHLNLIDQQIKSPHVTRAMKQQLLHGLIMIQAKACAAPDHLSNILNRGVLRVGTTGDYRPFSFVRPGSNQLMGVDIDLAEDLARVMGVDLQLVETTWPTLMSDLAAEKFDIGMSGISRTLLRQRTAFFSSQYFLGGKTPIALCRNKDKFDSLGKIDQPGVRVIVNPGGSNEKFIRQQLKNAQIIVYPDNTTIFEQLSKNNADVMITDDIEVKVQEATRQELCGTMPRQPLVPVEKGFLLPQDIVLKEYVDAWLNEIKQSGKLQAIFARYLGGVKK